MTALAGVLREMIAADGPITVETYMRICLQHPEHGYYTTREAIGGSGDFVTAPEIDQMFGELLGLWAARVWIDMGAPPVVRLVELGPGRGTLMADALRAVRVVPGFQEAIRVDLVETSPRLEAEQREKLAVAAKHLAWYRSIADLPDGPVIVIANEFFDALPVRHFWRGPTGWHDRVVGLDETGALTFGAAAEPIKIPTHAGSPGQVLEIGQAADRVMRDLAGRIAARGGALLVCDYGHAETSIGETLQAMRGHAHAGVLDAPGEADLTAHVDFAALARAAKEAGASVHGPIAQGLFLRRLGIAERAAALKRRASEGQAQIIDAALARLTAPASSMATLFKAFAVTTPGAPTPPGFEEVA